MLISEAFEYPLGCVALLLEDGLVSIKYLIDAPHEPWVWIADQCNRD